jgi:uncharacterized protein
MAFARFATPMKTSSKSASSKALQPWVSCAASSIHGRGVYARRDIPSGTRVMEYTGEKITKAEAKRREERRLERLRRGEEACVYIFDLNRTHDLDGSTDNNIARLINHSCSPNCRSEKIRGRIWIIATRDIPTGAEITFDYGFPLNEWRMHPCRCGAAGCVGYIVNKPQRWRVRGYLRTERKSRGNPSPR